MMMAGNGQMGMGGRPPMMDPMMHHMPPHPGSHMQRPQPGMMKGQPDLRKMPPKPLLNSCLKRPPMLPQKKDNQVKSPAYLKKQREV